MAVETFFFPKPFDQMGCNVGRIWKKYTSGNLITSWNLCNTTIWSTFPFPCLPTPCNYISFVFFYWPLLADRKSICFLLICVLPSLSVTDNSVHGNADKWLVELPKTWHVRVVCLLSIGRFCYSYMNTNLLFAPLKWLKLPLDPNVEVLRKMSV